MKQLLITGFLAILGFCAVPSAQEQADSAVVSDSIPDLTKPESALIHTEPSCRFEKSALVHDSRRKGYGGCFVHTPAAVAINLRPIRRLARNDQMLSVHTFPSLQDRTRAVMGSGSMGYGGVGKGWRIGGAGWSGNWREESERYGEQRDSIIILENRLRYGGLLIEKACTADRFNLILGGMLSFGRLEVKLQESSARSAFRSTESIKEQKGLTARARFTGMEAHAGFTYSFLSWMHVGGDVNALIGTSISGFDRTGADPFNLTAQGVRLRLVLGNLG